MQEQQHKLQTLEKMFSKLRKTASPGASAALVDESARLHESGLVAMENVLVASAPAAMCCMMN